MSVHDVAPPAAKSFAEAKVTDVKCHPFGEENIILNGHQEVLPSGKEDEEAKQLFYSTFKDKGMVIYLRLHCTVCNCHVGCARVAYFSMGFHKFLHVMICKDCETYYGSGDSACGGDSETFLFSAEAATAHL